jgi:tripartite ATP-independent transporter DctP family solute receptor
MLPSPISRRRFSASLIPAGALLLISRRARAAQFELRQFHNQPAESPLHKRLVEMWAVVKAETHGRIQVETFAENDRIAGGDPAALRMLIDGRLDFFTLNGGLIGTVVPAVDVQGIPFAFRTPAQAYDALDGDLGKYLRDEMSAKDIYAVPRGCFENGFRQITCAIKPVRTVDDLRGLKVRTPDSPVYSELFQALGATPVPINLNQAYDALKTGAADAQENPLAIVELFKFYEVQKYVSLTSHVWAGFNLIANLKLWQRLPLEVQGVIERNAAKFARLQRADNDALNIALRSRLVKQGMTFNTAETASFRARLGPFYARWKEKVGQRAWSLLEAHVGKLG